MYKMKVFLAAMIALSIVLAGCKSDKSNKDVDYEALSTTAFDFSNGYYRKGYTEEEERYKLVPAKKSKSFGKAQIDGVELGEGQVSVSVSGFELGQETEDAHKMSIANDDQGQHIKFFIDSNDPISSASNTFQVNLPNGQHYLLTTLSRSYNETIKENAAHHATFVEINDGKLVNEWDIPEPAIFLTSPYGPLEGVDAKRVLLDFYPVNCTVGEDVFIELYVNGEYKYLNKWEPMYIEGLPYGQNTIAVKLVDALGEQIPAKQTAVRKMLILERGNSVES